MRGRRSIKRKKFALKNVEQIPRKLLKGVGFPMKGKLVGRLGTDLGHSCSTKPRSHGRAERSPVLSSKNLTLLCPGATPEVPLISSWCGPDCIRHQHSPPDPKTRYLTLLVPPVTVWKPSLTQFPIPTKFRKADKSGESSTQHL